jgi:hypothetical protein
LPTEGESWLTAFFALLERDSVGPGLQAAARSGSLGEWTRELTSAVVATCGELGWLTAAKHHDGPLPVARGEYLALDATALLPDEREWPFPHAIFELENQRRDKYICYALWKTLCVRARLRVVFAYRERPEQLPDLIRTLTDKVIRDLNVGEREAIGGETVAVLGSRGAIGTFPYGYFKTWRLSLERGVFEQV